MSNLRDRQCRTCSAVFKGGPRAWYCPVCRLERQRAQSAAAKRRERAGLTRKIGSMDNCIHCGKEYEVKGGKQVMCPDCKPEAYAETDRKQSLKYYDKNKEAINPVRNERRRIGVKICEVCGKEFETSTRRLTCSEECKRVRTNRKWNERNRQKKIK